MAASYILTFSDPTKITTITVPSTTDGPGINNTSTSLDLVGAGYTNYGLPTAKNFLKLLENFSGPVQPSHAIQGQLWYDTSSARPVLRINNGQVTSARWPSANGIYQQATDPKVRYVDNITDGDIWVDTGSNQLKIRYSNDWTIIGPNVQSGLTKSGSESAIIESTTGDTFPVILNWANGKVVEIISYNAFTPRTVIDGFATVKIGTNITTRVAARYNGLAEKASALELSSGVLVTASEVLKNNATTQTITGSLNIESATGLLIRSNSTSPSIKIYSDQTNGYVNFANASSAATLTVGVTTSSYLKFNSGYASVGINKSPTSTSPALDVAGGASFTGAVTITASADTALVVSSGATFGGPIQSTNLLALGLTTSTGKVTVGTTGTNGIIIEPAYDGIFDIGSSTKKFREIHANDIHATAFHGSVTGSASSLTSQQSFFLQGQTTATSVSFNGTGSVTFNTTLTRDAINAQSTVGSVAASHTMLVLNTATTTSSLEKVSKAAFLSDVYPNLFVTGMITAYGASTLIPSGFLKCDNSSTSTTAHPALFGVIGSTYGTAGPGTFRTPNMSTSTAIAGVGYVTYIIKT